MRLPVPMAALAALILTAAASSACAHKVHVRTDPAGARLSLNGEPVGVAPTAVEVLWLPFKPMELEVQLSGYRDVTLNLQGDVGPLRLFGELLRPWTWDRWWGAELRARHEVLMIRKHGRAGTWTPEDAER